MTVVGFGSSSRDSSPYRAEFDAFAIRTSSSLLRTVYAAGQQHHFWDYALLFYHEQGPEDTHYVTPRYLSDLARQISGLNLERWQADRGSPGLAARVNADESAANSAGITGTPTVIMYGPSGKKQVVLGISSYAQLQRAIAHVR
jgi:predicted DsbA family dithiol-disulfide isomerase